MNDDIYKGMVVERDGKRSLEMVIVDGATVVEPIKDPVHQVELLDKEVSLITDTINGGADAILSLEELATDLSESAAAEEVISPATHDLLVSDIESTVDVFEGDVSDDLVPSAEAFQTPANRKMAYRVATEAFSDALQASFNWLGKKAGELLESLRKFVQGAESAATDMQAAVDKLHAKLDDVPSEPEQAAFLIEKAKRYYINGKLPSDGALSAFMKKLNIEYLEPFKRSSDLADGEATLSKALGFAKTYVEQSKHDVPDRELLQREAEEVIKTSVSALQNAGKVFVVAQHDSAEFDTHTTNEHIGTLRAWVKFPRVSNDTVYSLKEYPGKMAAIKAGLSEDSDMGKDQMTPTFSKDELRAVLDEVSRSMTDIKDLMSVVKANTSNVERIQAGIGAARIALMPKLPAQSETLAGLLNNVLLGTIAFDNAVGRIRSIRVKALLKANNAALDFVRKHIAAYEGNARGAEASNESIDVKPFKDSLNAPATGDELNKLKKALDGVSIPTELVDLLKKGNGQNRNKPIFRGFDFMSVDEIIKEIEYYKYSDDGEDYTADKGVKPVFWDKHWIPFASSGGGDHLMIDMAPASGGVKGQVICVDHETSHRSVVAESITAYLEKLYS